MSWIGSQCQQSCLVEDKCKLLGLGTIKLPALEMWARDRGGDFIWSQVELRWV